MKMRLALIVLAAITGIHTVVVWGWLYRYGDEWHRFRAQEAEQTLFLRVTGSNQGPVYAVSREAHSLADLHAYVRQLNGDRQVTRRVRLRVKVDAGLDVAKVTQELFSLPVSEIDIIPNCRRLSPAPPFP